MRSRFARKNYYYPDLPKGYQVSQDSEPIAVGGSVDVWSEGELINVSLTRIHMEEDAGKNIHLSGSPYSMVDLNRAGVPLIEIVSEPEIYSPVQAADYMRAVRSIVRAIDVSDGNLEQGSLRCDANISLRPWGQKALGTKVEIKNINSFRFVQQALEYEIIRQTQMLKAGEEIKQETRLYDTERNETRAMRSKEEAHDYRYFPEPDLPVIVIDDDRYKEIAASVPELPLKRRERFMSQYDLSEYDATELTRETALANYYESTVSLGAHPKKAANWILTELLSKVEDAREVGSAPVAPAGVADLLGLVESGKLSSKLAKEAWPLMWASGKSAEVIAKENDLFQDSDPKALDEAIDRIIAANPGKVAEYKSGKEKLMGWFVGQCMRETKGKANPGMLNQRLKDKLS